MSEEQLKAAEAEATEEQEEGSGEEISEDDLEGVNGGNAFRPTDGIDAFGCTCGDEDCDCLSCDSEATPV